MKVISLLATRHSVAQIKYFHHGLGEDLTDGKIHLITGFHIPDSALKERLECWFNGGDCFGGNLFLITIDGHQWLWMLYMITSYAQEHRAIGDLILPTPFSVRAEDVHHMLCVILGLKKVYE
jgi:hypothetical protein